MIDQEDYKGYHIEIHPDEDARNPRTEFDNATEMICFHRRYNLGDKHDFVSGNYKGWNGLRAELEKDSAAILPLYLYDHGGITMNTAGFSCPWDSGQVGFIRVTKDAAKENWPDYDEKRLLDALRADVKIYDAYLTGQVVGYVVKDADDDEVDSCWGYYDRDDAIAVAKDVIDYHWKSRHELFTQAGVEVVAQTGSSTHLRG